MNKDAKQTLTTQEKKANNGSMAQNLDEIKKLGKEMEQAKTGSELQKKNLTQDPQQ